MLIVLHSGGIPFNGSTVNEKSLGGSESAAYYVARELAAAGHEVKVFTNITPEEQGEFDGVEYISAGQISQATPLGEMFELWARGTQIDVLMIQRSAAAFHKRYQAKVTLHWLHDVGVTRARDAMLSGVWQVDRFLPVSYWHKQQLVDVLKLPADAVTPITNGVDPALFEQAQDNRHRADAVLGIDQERGIDLNSSPRLLYSSRPERGLENLVRPGGVMDRLQTEWPSAHLYVCGYQHDVPAMADYYNWLAQRCIDLPNVTMLGHLTKAQLAQVMKTCHLQVYPTTFEEVSCITAMEAMHAGLPMVTTPVAALPETCENAGVLFSPLKDGQPDVDAFILEMKRAVMDWDILHKAQLKAAQSYTWKRTAQQVLDIVGEVLERKTQNPEAMALHLRRLSDIKALQFYMSNLPKVTRESSRILTEVQRELDTIYMPIRSNDLAKLYDQTVVEELADGAAAAFDLRQHPRIRAVGDMMEALPSGAKVLDIGCYLGAPACAWAQQHQHMVFDAVDISATAASHAREVTLPKLRELFDNDKLNVDFRHYEGPQHLPVNEYDAIVLAEVLEHQWDARSFVRDCLKTLKPGGKAFITVPYGPWEHEQFRRSAYREHVHHFERDDLRKMFGHLEDCQVMTLQGPQDPWGEPRGWHIVTFTWNDGDTVGMIDYHKKLQAQAPRETVSLCTIAKDASLTIGKMLNSVRDVVDEVLIYVDAEAGVDDYMNTREAVNLVTSKWNGFPHVEVHVSHVSALRDGFDTARNAAIEEATGDWIMWLDCDEELVSPISLPAFMRNSGVTAYVMEQHHLSIEPAGTLTIDKPARVFRNRRGVKFYGVVHEHPEQKFGEGVGYATLLGWPKIAHTGYYTEEIRRKRFNRNFDLMQRDRYTYPDRVLGKYLWLRDCALMVSYIMERHGQLTQQGEAFAREGLRMYAELLKTKHLRFLTEGLTYYSTLNQVLGLGFEAEVTTMVRRPGGSTPQPQQLRGKFGSIADYKRLIELLTDEQTADIESRYF